MNLVHGALTWCFLPWLSSRPHQHHSPNVILFLAAMLYADTCLFPEFGFFGFVFLGGWVGFDFGFFLHTPSTVLLPVASHLYKADAVPCPKHA